MDPTNGLLILGASARSAAFSALRAGLRPAAIDLFADLDLSAIGTARRVDPRDYPDGLEALAAEAPPGPWIYTGAIENHPDLVDRIDASRPLWGHRATTLRAVRDPFRVAEVLADAGLACPEVCRSSDGLDRRRRWLVKPFASAGGRRIRPFVAASEPPGPSEYLQEWIGGRSLSAVLVGERSDARLLGITRQLIGESGASRRFHYRGSLGPWPVSEAVRTRVEFLGRTLAGSFGLVGLFGIDFILRDEVPWPVEVNPRYTASVEVLELALGRSLLAEHVAAFDPAFRKSAPATEGDRPAVVGKAILFADRPVEFPRLPVWRGGFEDPFAVPRIADIPAPGTEFEAGDPIMTVFAAGRGTSGAYRRLERRLARWHERLGRSRP